MEIIGKSKTECLVNILEKQDSNYSLGKTIAGWITSLKTYYRSRDQYKSTGPTVVDVASVKGTFANTHAVKDGKENHPVG